VSIRSTMVRRITGAGVPVVLGTALTAGAVVAALPAEASAATIVHASYKVTGSTHLAGPGFSMTLGPGKLSSALNAGNGKLTAKLSLPDSTGSFKQFGLIPVTSTTQFINDGPTTGKVNLKTGAVSTTSKITLRIVSLSVAGVSVPVGSSCETSAPVVVQVKSEAHFSILGGGKLGGSYTIGDFAHCGLATVLINSTIPAAGNTITLKLGKAKLG
jgi:hypothetical protein